MPYGDDSGDAVMLALGEDYPELRESVRKICDKYPGAYWRKLEDEQAYPTEFIAELTQGGFLASLIPEEYGGSGLPLRAAAVILVDLRESLGKGLEIRPIEAMINHNTTEVFFDNLKVPAENLIGEEGKGFRYILDGMNAERILVAQECIGDGRWLLKKGIDYAKERVVFDKPIGQNQGVQFPLARAYAELEAADMICRRAAALFDAGKECGADANMAKLLASEATWHAADATFQTFGGFAFAKEYDIERKWREVRLYQTAPISTNLILAYLGQHVLGMPRSY